jgi:ATP-binding protein involved in chromosome partitioning
MNNRLALLQERLESIEDPLTGKGLFSSGRISGLQAGPDGKVSFTIEAPAEAVARYAPLRERAEAEARALPGVESVVAVLTAHEASARPAAGGIARVKHVIAVASAKGGVGKSTLAVNLACAFALTGLKAGLLDLDVYGPSAPTLLGVRGMPEPGPDRTIQPIDAFGIKTMSIGYLVDAASAMVWRGAMATSAVRQMIDEVVWGELDALLIDMPPGTGDVQLTLVQRVPLAGAIIVSTPQEMALADVRRGIAMFDKTRTPVLGVVENMAYLETPEGGRQHLFGEGGARRTALEAGVPFLGEMPIDIALRVASDTGRPLVVSAPESATARRFRDIAAAAYANIERLAKPAPKITVR